MCDRAEKNQHSFAESIFIYWMHALNRMADVGEKMESSKTRMCTRPFPHLPNHHDDGVSGPLCLLLILQVAGTTR